MQRGGRRLLAHRAGVLIGRFPFGWRRAREDAPEPRAPVTDDDRRRAVLAYHALTRHDPQRFAPGPGWLDWENQPDPFRRYAGAEVIGLEHLGPASAGPSYTCALEVGSVPSAPPDRRSISRLLGTSLGLSAWKQLESSRWALRVNPSSGNLHPTEAYLLAGPVPGLCETPVVAHYAPREHALELRARPDPELWQALLGELPPEALLVGLSSIAWREAWKYGERAYRYCQHDAGHAIACLSLAAGALGWRTRLLDELGSAEVARLLGLDRPHDAEREEAEALLLLLPQDAQPARLAPPTPAVLAAFAALDWRGTPSELSREHVDWQGIEVALEVCAKPRGAAQPARPFEPPRRPALPPPEKELTFQALALQRRSAVAFDRQTEIPRASFLRMLAATLPAAVRRPFDALPWQPRLHLALFVHRVRDVEPGLLVLLRDEAARPLLEAELGGAFERLQEPGVPPELPLLRLARGNLQATARALSCGQEIAGDGCFAVAMLGDLGGALDELGPQAYPRLHWEAGAIGQVLYLEAEAAGVRATGIGCFFDDETSRALGLASPRLRSLYHFTVGGAVEDTRLTSLPPYPPPDGPLRETPR